MSAPAPLERDRDLARLLDDTVSLYRRHLGAALALAAAVVIPVELIVSGIGLGQLTSGYDDNSAGGAAAFGSLVSLLVTTPLVTGMLVALALADERDGGEGAPSARRAAAVGLERFGALVGAVLLASLGVMLGLIALIVPGIIFAVRWVVVAPAVVVEGHRGSGALRRSWELVTGHGWWVLGVMLVQGLIVGILGAVVAVPADALARSADSEAPALAGTIVAQVVGLPFSAFATTLLFFTLRARATGVAPDGTAPPAAPPTEETWRPPAAQPVGGDEAPSPGPGGWEPPVPPR